MTDVAETGKKSLWKAIGQWVWQDLLGNRPKVEEVLTPAQYTETIKDKAREVLVERRRILQEAGVDIPVPNASMGIAFSGGGIRSATLSLGIAQALARKGRLLDFDYCSTVSGGGYFGSFLGGLFLPDEARGPKKSSDLPDAESTPGALKEKTEFALSTLIDQASLTEKDIGKGDDKKRIRHPVRWLREHSRYLAPNGTSDYVAGAAYLIRNWIAMIYVFTLPIALASILLIAVSLAMTGPAPTLDRPAQAGSRLPAVQATGFDVSDWLYLGPPDPEPCECKDKRHPKIGVIFSPAWLATAFAAFVGLSVGVAYWLTEYLSDRGSAFRNALQGVVPGRMLRLLTGTLDFFGASRTKMVGIVLVSAGAAALAQWSWRWFSGGPGWGAVDALITAAIALTAFACLFCLRAMAGTLFAKDRANLRGDAFTAEIRRVLTRWSSDWLIIVLILAGIAIIDTLGLTLFAWIVDAARGANSGPFIAGLATLLAPLGAWIINKLPGWFKDGDGALGRWIGRYIWTAALIVALMLYGLLAVSIHVGIQFLLFGNAQWAVPGASDPAVGSWRVLAFMALFILVLFRFTGASQGFINLSSLHAIYAARLTRAYVGASNLQRLALKGADGMLKRSERSIKESDPQDQIPIHIYQQTRTAAPIHLINVTLNETKGDDKSQMLERDRKGVPLVFAPEGVFMDTAKLLSPRTHFSWEEVRNNGVEGLSLGQLCAISGAAASTGMGARTSLGGSLALSFANIRLGYWWHVGRMIQQADGSGASWLARAMVRLLGTTTYFYLVSEMLGRYTRDTSYINISDGGHFENSGAYELLRRNVRTIVVADNGADPRFLFGDLENLVRKARIDLGMAIVVADHEEVEALVGEQGLPLFLNGSTEDWRARAAARSPDGVAAAPKDGAFCLLLKVCQRPWNVEKGDFDVEEALTGHILWIKPRLFEGLPLDITGYATEHPSFPQETTGDQFFDEAQWESYRALGYAMTKQLMELSFHGPDLLRQINNKDRWAT
jgi:hypothetical protein